LTRFAREDLKCCGGAVKICHQGENQRRQSSDIAVIVVIAQRSRPSHRLVRVAMEL